MPSTYPIAFGPRPEPVAAFAATVLDDVTYGYVPWSTSSMVPCAPSNRMRLPARRSPSRISKVGAMNGNTLGAAANNLLRTAAGEGEGRTRPRAHGEVMG